VLQDRTLFPGIQLLPPASLWIFQPGHPLQKRTYFSKEMWECQPKLAPEDYYEKLKVTFARVLPTYLSGPEKVAVSLTGGLDSRLIMAWSRRDPSSLPCFTHGGIYRDPHDVRLGRLVASACRQPYEVIKVDERFFPEFPALAQKSVYYTDGSMDVTGSVGLYVNRKAREIAPVRLTGNYGSEILRSAVSLRAHGVHEPMFNGQFLPAFRKARATYAAEADCPPTSFIAFKQVPWYHFARYALEQSQLTIRSPYLDNELVALAYQAPAELSFNQGLAARLITDGNPQLTAFPTDRGPLGRPGVLGKLSEQFQEFTFKAEYAYDYGMPQWVARVDHLLSWLRLETQFLGRHKYYHFRVWYRDQLSPFVKELLLDSRSLSRPYLNRKVVEQMVMNHTRGEANYTKQIHLLLTTELIQRELIERT
jgi:asparagine synthase (glutamine-hydrolysing)